MSKSPLCVPRWEPHDFAFPSQTRHANPFTASFSARVHGPDEVRFDAHGFHDGRGRWKIRLAPWLEGHWSLVTHSNDPDLDGQHAELTCVANEDPDAHGGLRVDPDHPHHFVFDDGTRYFLLGYECDWLWALDMDDPALPTLGPFLDKLAAHGFNHVILNAYAHDCPWRAGRTGADDYGPPPHFAWRGSNERPDHSRLNLAYWHHYDRVVAALARRGIIAHIMIRVYNKMVTWPANASAEDDLYFRWLIARYAPYPNVVWDFSKEAHNERDVAYKRDRFRLLRDEDPYRRLRTIHDDDRAYDANAYDPFVDFRSDQQHSDWHATILRQRALHRWPVANVEFGYEHGPGGIDDFTYRVVQAPEEVCRRAWEICLAGGYPAYYYTYTAWDVIRPEHTPPGYALFRRLREFFQGTRYWLMEPSDPLVSAGHCLANPGHEYVVYLDRPEPFSLEVRRAGGELAGEWFRPLTGRTRRLRSVRAGCTELTPPWRTGPVVLHIGSRPEFSHRGSRD